MKTFPSLRALVFATLLGVCAAGLFLACSTSRETDNRQEGVVPQDAAVENSGYRVRVQRVEVSGSETTVLLSVVAANSGESPTTAVPIQDSMSWAGFEDGIARVAGGPGGEFSVELPPLAANATNASLTIGHLGIRTDEQTGTVSGPWVLPFQLPGEAERAAWLRTEDLVAVTTQMSDGTWLALEGIRSRTRTIVEFEMLANMQTLDPPYLLLESGSQIYGSYETDGTRIRATFSATPFGSPIQLQLGPFSVGQDQDGRSARIDLSGIDLMAGVGNSGGPLFSEDHVQPALLPIEPSRVEGSIDVIQYAIGADGDRPYLAVVVLGAWLPEVAPLSAADANGRPLESSDSGSSFGAISGFDGVTPIPPGGATKIRFYLDAHGEPLPESVTLSSTTRADFISIDAVNLVWR